MSDALRGPALRKDLKALLVARLRLRDVDPERIDDDESLAGGSLGLDSIDMLELSLGVEERYGVKITDEHLARSAFRTIAALAAFVEIHGAPGGAAAPAGVAATRGPARQEPTT